MLSGKARQCGTVGRARGSRLKVLRVTGPMVSLLWDPGSATINTRVGDAFSDSPSPPTL